MGRLYDFLSSLVSTVKETQKSIPTKISQLEKDVEFVDNTLTQIGKAADAAVVGGRLSALSEEIENKANAITALESLAECGVIVPVYQDGVFYTDASGAIYVL